jgi:hypothetical protein
MIDSEPVSEFEKQFATVLDTLDRLKSVRPPTKAEDKEGMLRWMREIHEAAASMPDLPDPDRLTRYAEDVDANVRRVENKAEMALSAKRQLPNPMVLTPEPLWAKITALKTTAGATWSLGVLWPWYCTANPCDSAGGHVDTDTTVYLRFPPALSVDILTKGGPGVCGHAAGDVVAYTLSDGQTSAADGNVIGGDILWHSLKVKHHLPIYAEELKYKKRALWLHDDEPNVVLGYTTGWVIESKGKFLRTPAVGEHVLDTGGAENHFHVVDNHEMGTINTGTLSPPTYFGPEDGPVTIYGDSITGHTHSVVLGTWVHIVETVSHRPPFVNIHVIEWKGF